MWVRGEIDRILENTALPLIGVTSLAIGADQLFAEAVLRHHGTLHAIVPFPEYERTFSSGRDLSTYHQLLREAAQVEILAKHDSDEEAYLAAGRAVVEKADLLVAVWDREPAAGLGGTADVVLYAEQVGRKRILLNPLSRVRLEW